MVRNVEESSGASCYQDRGHAGFLIQISCPLQKWRDRLFLPADDLLHEIIPHHKVSGGGIFINQKQPASRLNAFQHARRLGSASAGVRRGKAFRVLAVWQVIDEHGDIGIPDGTAFLGPQFHRGLIRQDKFPSVSCNVVVHAHLQRGKHRRFSMIAAAHDQRDACRNRHATNLSVMGQNKALLHRLRGNKRNTVLHRLVRNTAFSRQNRAVCHKGHYISLPHPTTQLSLVFSQPYRCLQRLSVQIFCEEALFRCFWQKIKEDLFQSTRVNGSSKGRKAHMKAHSNGVAADLTGASLQNLLPTPADGDQTTLAGALCPKAEPLCLGEKQSRQMILQCNALTILIPQFFRKA